jgi:ABC-type transporter Mla subunit MlaD
VKKLIVVVIIAVGVAAVVGLFINRLRFSRQYLKSCFTDVGGLRAGAPVRIAGVEVGTVRSVRAHPQDYGCPAEVEMTLVTTYEIRIPKDSIAETETEGLLGGVYVNIDTTQASGTPIENYGYLKGKSGKRTSSLADQLRDIEDQLRATDAAHRLVQSLSETQKSEKEVPKNSHPPTAPPGR